MIILSIPFHNNQIVQKAINEHPQFWYEFRLDFSDDISRFPAEFISEKSIITIRDPAAGGKNSFRDKISFYQEVIAKHNCLVDCELDIIPREKILQIPPENLILSFHDFREKVAFEEIRKVIEQANRIPAKFLKIAVNLNSYSDLLPIPKLIKLSNKPVLFVGMGNLGKLSRLLYSHLGSIGTYIGLEKALTAGGQLTVSEANTFQLHSVTKQTKIGGIVGGKQVEKSLGLSFYNNFFQDKKLDAIYLPFQVIDLKDFKGWIENSQMEFYGFSVTMPHKQNFWEKPINLFLPKSRELLNTDEIALKRAFSYLEISDEETILVYGSGGTAEMILMNYQKNVFLAGRNETEVTKLAKQHDVRFADEKQSFDLIINCTPLGMKGEDFLLETGFQLPKKIIDLPYSSSETSLINKCRQNKIPFVDGKMFWNWQAKKQLEKFLEHI